jgi:hypothetical protein
MIDPIVQEVRISRAAIAAKYHYNRSEIIAAAREQTRQRKQDLKQASPGTVARPAPSQEGCAVAH